MNKAKLPLVRRRKSAKIVGAAECLNTQTAPDRNGQTLTEGAHRVTAIPHSNPTDPVRTVPNLSSEVDIQLLAWAVSNCHTLAHRRLRAGSPDAEWWSHVLRICEKAGAKSVGVLRAGVPAEITDGELPTVPNFYPLTLSIRSKHMPAFGAYLAGTVKTGRAEIVLNINSTLWALSDIENVPDYKRGEFKRTIIDTLAHEFIHALEEQFGLLFDEDAVEQSIERVRSEAIYAPVVELNNLRWQPIATAPKDEAVLTLRGGGLMAVAELIPDGRDDHEWLVVDGSFIVGVTHWMPLPVPPANTEAVK